MEQVATGTPSDDQNETQNDSGNETWSVGEVTITRLVEFGGSFPIDVFTNSTLSAADIAAAKEVAWTRPHYLGEGDLVTGASNSFLVQTPDKRIVVDTGVGNHKTRASFLFNGVETDYLERFTQIWDPTSVDYVLSTHLHSDHIGWNTRLEDGRWVPTFPQAEYLFLRPEYEHWERYAATPGAGDGYTEEARAMVDGAAAFEDSLRPIVDAGLVTWTEPGARITPEVRLLPTPGHTPGHTSVVIESGGRTVIVAGDLIHLPCQAAHPEWVDELDTDKAQGVQARTDFLDTYADTDVMMLLAHVGPSPAAYVTRDGEGFRLVPAASTPPTAPSFRL